MRLIGGILWVDLDCAKNKNNKSINKKSNLNKVYYFSF